MPQIPEYTASQPGISAPESGVEAFAMAGRRIGTFYHQEGEEIGSAIGAASREAQRYLDHQEISHGAVGLAGLTAKFTQDWNDTAKGADPNDPLVATRFRAKIEPELEDFANSFHTEAGQKWAEARVDALRTHLFEKTTADMSSLARIAAGNNAVGVGNSLAVTARNDPSAVPFLLETAHESLKGIAAAAPNMSPQDQATLMETHGRQVDEGIVRAGALGLAEKSGGDEAAMSRYTTKYSQYINPGEANQFAKAAQANRRALNYDQDRQQRLEDRKIQDDSTDRLDAIVQDAFGGKPKISMQDVVNDPSLTQQDREHAIRVLQKEATPEPAARVSHETWSQIMTDIHNDVPDVEKKIWDNMKKLNRADFLSLRAELGQVTEMRNDIPQMRGPAWEATRQAVHDTLTFSIPGLTGVKDASGEGRYADFLHTFTGEVLRERRAGTLQPNAFSTQDPDSLLNKTLEMFKRTPTQKLGDAMNALTQFKGLAEKADEITLPPVGERKAGQTYPTARGQMKWTGTGWVNP